MTLSEQAIRTIRTWLSSAQGYESISAFVRKKMAMSTTGFKAMSQYGKEFFHHEDQENPEEIIQDFVVFLLAESEASLLRQPNTVQILLNGNIRLFLDLQWNKFIWSLQEKARRKKGNPIGYLYRRFREVVMSGEVFRNSRGTDGLLYYSSRGDGEAVKTSFPIGNALVEDNYSGWPDPPLSLHVAVDGDFRVTTQWLTNTAQFFWQHANQITTNAQWLPVREIVRYLGTIHPWLNKPQVVSGDDEEQGWDSLTHSATVSAEDSETRLVRLRQLQSIVSLAAQLVEVLSPEECCVLYWRSLDNPRSFQEIAEDLKLKSHNQAYSLFTRAQKNVRTFCGNWPGPPIEDLEEGVAEVFIESLIEQAKNRCSGPYYGAEDIAL